MVDGQFPLALSWAALQQTRLKTFLVEPQTPKAVT